MYIYIYTLRVLLLLASVPRRWMAVRFSLFSTTLSPASIQQRGAVSPTRIYTQHFGTRLDYDSFFFLLSLLFGFPRGLKDVSLSLNVILLLKVEAAQEGNGDPKKDEARRQQNLDKPAKCFYRNRPSSLSVVATCSRLVTRRQG